MEPKLDWVADPDWKARILQTWLEYENDPKDWRLNRYWALVYEVPIEDKEPARLQHLPFDPVSPLNDAL